MKTKITALIAVLASLSWEAQASASIQKRHRHSCNDDDRANFYVGRCTSTTRFFYDEAALYLIGELGPKANRVDGALSYEVCSGNGFKIAGGMLNQELKFFVPHFGKEYWVSQYYGGGAYQFDIGRYCLDSLEIAGGYSCAPSRDFKKSCHLEDEHHHSKKHNKRKHGHGHHGRRDHHRHRTHHCDHHDDAVHYRSSIAGSRYAFGSIGATITPCNATTFWAAATYDHVIYDLKYCCQEVVEGVGGAFKLTQRLTPCLYFDFSGQFRKPYDYYEGRLMYSEILYNCDVVLGVFAGRTNGHHGMPSSSIVGLEIGFDFCLTNYSSLSSVSLCPRSDTPFTPYSTESFKRWAAQPAFYIPQVIAKKDCVSIKR